MWGDDVGALRNILDLTVGGVGNSVEEIKHTESLCCIKELEIENYGVTVKQIVCDIADFVEAYGANDLELDIAVRISGVSNHG